LGPGQNPEQFTLIMEFKLQAKTQADVLDWANSWHALSTHPFPSEEYNAALEALALRFSGRNTAPGRVNGSSLGQLRTNEISLAPRWELREFTLSPDTGFLSPSTVKLTPDLGSNGTSTLAQFVNANAPAIIADQHTVPEQFNGAPFLGGSVFNDLIAWTAPGILDNEARHHLSLNTCNGCHGSAETNTFFLHVAPRFPGSQAVLSGFLTGTSVSDPVSGQLRTFNDLSRRNADLKALVCTPTPTIVKLSKAAPALSPAFIAKGTGRVH
jgi:hypothetical protein